jgi:hypothetical protein
VSKVVACAVESAGCSSWPRNAGGCSRQPFYLYACNLARIAGFKELFRGFDRPVFGSTDVTGPAAAQNWRVEWESEGGAVSDTEAVHAEAEVFDRPGAMRLELARTKQTARKDSGGKAPRTQLTKSGKSN